jgi:hypothetical protein
MTEYYSGGFDLRVSLESLTDEPTLQKHWLVPANQNRISADAMVWPMPEEVSRFYQETPRSYPLGCLNNFSELLSALRERGVATMNYTPICLTISEASVQTLRKKGWAYHFSGASRMEDLVKLGWRFLGFDVAELNGLCSGLKGCGYTEPSWSQLRARFGSALNEVGLFHGPTIAGKFAQIRGLEIPNHAPFEVVALLVHDPR